MKKLFVAFIALFAYTSSGAQNTYLNIGTSITTNKNSNADATEKVSFGGVLGKTNFGVIVETNEGKNGILIDGRRSWYTGVEIQQGVTISPTVDFLLGAEGKVDVTRKTNNYLFLEPQAGFGFNITDKVSFQALYGVQFSERDNYNLNKVKGQADLGLQFKF